MGAILHGTQLHHQETRVAHQCSFVAIVLVIKVHHTAFKHVKPMWYIVAIETGPPEAGKRKSLRAAATAGPQLREKTTAFIRKYQVLT